MGTLWAELTPQPRFGVFWVLDVCLVHVSSCPNTELYSSLHAHFHVNLDNLRRAYAQELFLEPRGVLWTTLFPALSWHILRTAAKVSHFPCSHLLSDKLRAMFSQGSGLSQSPFSAQKKASLWKMWVYLVRDSWVFIGKALTTTFPDPRS